MDKKDIINAANNFYSRLKKDKNSRERSWEHCYNEFYKARKSNIDNEKKDYLALQLAFYLASWGMYRGSSFLLQKDYKVHADAVTEILKKDYEILQGIKCADFNKDNLKLLFDLKSSLKVHYSGIRGKETKSPISDILITKILIGTLGCVPAYDTYFLKGITNAKIPQSFNSESVERLIEFYKDNEVEFNRELSKMTISNSSVKYPQMKFIDMGFWQIGYDMEVNNFK